MNDNLPPMPGHPEPHTMVWSRLERETIEAYGKACWDAAIEHQSVPQPQPVGVFREDDDIGHVELCPHQQAKLQDGDRLFAAAPQPQPVQEPVAHCELTKSGSIAFFDGRPMVMVGPVGNDCHPHPLYTSPQAQPLIEVLTELESMYDKADKSTPLHKGMRMAISTACDRVNAVMKKHSITKGTT